ncbi:MAG: nicotinamidase/pyrazinamidase [Thermotogaceae bacterium]|nr:nicotinamidase/pyrazinamidase [Thermotogaceae bacterium]MDN5337771.1 nicotinamidase/pyrazinamidase [Thermotogaceae bacterium]
MEGSETLKALLLIDLQNDFVEQNGVLYFDGAEKVIPFALEKIRYFRENGWPIITTQDWHEPDDEEFKMFPRHCVENTRGAMLQTDILKALDGYEKHYKIFKKRYSAFFGTKFDELIDEHNLDDFEVCGVVTNICVLFTVEELRNRDLKVRVYREGVNSYDINLHNFALVIIKEVLGAEVI